MSGATPEEEAKDFLLRTILEEQKSLGKIVGHIDGRTTQILETNQLLAQKFMRIVRRQKEEREKNEQRFRRIEHAIFPDPHYGPMRPPAPSESSDIHDIEELREGLARIKPHVEREMRHDSWWYRQRWGVVQTVASGGIVALLTAAITWWFTHGH